MFYLTLMTLSSLVTCLRTHARLQAEIVALRQPAMDTISMKMDPNPLALLQANTPNRSAFYKDLKRVQFLDITGALERFFPLGVSD
jgi:hypothetical protein